eukprot:1586558-Amphidinium_carterae.1
MELAQWKTLASAGAEYTKLVFNVGSLGESAETVYVAAILVDVRDGGLLLCLPGDSVEEAILSKASREGYCGIVGPHK